MDKKQAIKIISEAIDIYDKNFCNRNLLIIFGDIQKPSYVEIKANEKNFLHLTGLALNKQSLLRDISDKQSNLISVFYAKALNKKITVSDFDFKNNTTVQKLNVLVNTLKLSNNVKMVGDYSNLRVSLKTDKLAGSVSSFIGFIKAGKYYVPNTIMADDIRKNSNQTQKVFGILSKDKTNHRYCKIEYLAQKTEIKPLLKYLSDYIQIDELLFKATTSDSITEYLIHKCEKEDNKKSPYTITKPKCKI